MRGSDPDAAIYWLARMLEAGEDPRFIARRIVICASEDVGNADPQALVVAAAALQAVRVRRPAGVPARPGPGGDLHRHGAEVERRHAGHRQGARRCPRRPNAAGAEAPARRHTAAPSKLGHGEGYKYSHDYEGGWVEQAYLPEERRYYEPVDRGFEAEIKRRMEEWRSRKGKS